MADYVSIVDAPRVGRPHADVAELVDALASGASARKGVEVQVLLSAPINRIKSITRKGDFFDSIQRDIGASLLCVLY